MPTQVTSKARVHGLVVTVHAYVMNTN